MWAPLSSRIADKLFYGIMGLLILVLGGLGSFLIHQRLSQEERRLLAGVESSANYLEKTLAGPVARLNAKEIRQTVEGASAEGLQAIEILDRAGERVYIYERTGAEKAEYDRRVERSLVEGGKQAGKFLAYYSIAPVMQERRVREFLSLVVIISAAGLVLGAGLYSLVKRIVLRPIDATLRFSRDLAEGSYERRVAVSSQDEMGKLQGSLNRMANSMQELVEGLKSAFFEAEGARRKAQEASRLKSEFLATISHEIRTPLHSIMGFTDILLDEEKSEDRRQALKTIRDSGRILLETINNILDFSKIEAGKLTLSEVEFTLRELLEEVRPIIEVRLQGRRVQFRTDVPEALDGTMVGDRGRLRQVLLNLLINAAKFTEKGEVVLTVKEDAGTCLFAVRDTGIGIPQGQQQRIFEPFTQVDGTTTRGHGGTGLGLAIAKGLVEMMSGRIWLESEPGRGSTFYFTSPLRRG